MLVLGWVWGLSWKLSAAFLLHLATLVATFHKEILQLTLNNIISHIKEQQKLVLVGEISCIVRNRLEVDLEHQIQI